MVIRRSSYGPASCLHGFDFSFWRRTCVCDRDHAASRQHACVGSDAKLAAWLNFDCEDEALPAIRSGSAIGNGCRCTGRTGGGRIHDPIPMRFCPLVDKRCKSAAREQICGRIANLCRRRGALAAEWQDAGRPESRQGPPIIEAGFLGNAKVTQSFYQSWNVPISPSPSPA